MMLTQHKAQQIAEQWIEDWNQHHLDAILAHYSESITFTSPFVVKLTGDATGTIQGKPALREYFAKGLAAYPNLNFNLIRVLTGINHLVIYYHSINHLQAAEFMALDEMGLVNYVSAHYC